MILIFICLGIDIAQPGQLLYIVCPDKTVVEEDDQQPVWVVPGTRLLSGDADGYANVGANKGITYSRLPAIRLEQLMDRIMHN